MAKKRHEDQSADSDHEDADAAHEEGQDKHQPLKDPSEGQSPAIVAGPLVDPNAPNTSTQGPEPYAHPSDRSIGDIQREHSANIEAMGQQAYEEAGKAAVEGELAEKDRIQGYDERGPRQVPGVGPVTETEHYNG